MYFGGVLVFDGVCLFILAGDRYAEFIMMDNFGDKNSIQMDNFVPQEFSTCGQFLTKIHFRWTILCLRHTDTQTDTLLIFIPMDKPRLGLTPLTIDC